jgi:hypothetical protein
VNVNPSFGEVRAVVFFELKGRGGRAYVSCWWASFNEDEGEEGEKRGEKRRFGPPVIPL